MPDAPATAADIGGVCSRCKRAWKSMPSPAIGHRHVKRLFNYFVIAVLAAMMRLRLDDIVVDAGSAGRLGVASSRGAFQRHVRAAGDDQFHQRLMLAFVSDFVLRLKAQKPVTSEGRLVFYLETEAPDTRPVNNSYRPSTRIGNNTDMLICRRKGHDVICAPVRYHRGGRFRRVMKMLEMYVVA